MTFKPSSDFDNSNYLKEYRMQPEQIRIEFYVADSDDAQI